MTDPRVIRVAQDARALIENRYDWSPKGVGSARCAQGSGSRCLNIALQHAARRAGMPFEVYERAREIGYTLTDGQPLGAWNDADGRTHDQVLQLLERIEAVAREGA